MKLNIKSYEIIICLFIVFFIALSASHAAEAEKEKPLKAELKQPADPIKPLETGLKPPASPVKPRKARGRRAAAPDSGKIKGKPGGDIAPPAFLKKPKAPARKKPTTVIEKKASDPNKERFITINFNDVDIAVFIRYISETLNKNFIIDERVKGKKVTIISPSRISMTEAYKVFESVLEVHGLATVESGEMIKIIPAPDAKTKNIETRLKEEGVVEDKIVTQIISLKYADPNEIKTLLTPLVSKNSSMLSYAPTNMLIVTDVFSNIKKLLRILDVIDVSGIGQEITLIPVEYADASTLIGLLDSVFKEAQSKKAKSNVGNKIKLVADDRTNTVIVLASNVNTVRVRKLIGMLDREIPLGNEKFHVYYLENATAEDLVAVLKAIPQTKDQTKKTKGKKTAPIIPADISMTADKATNSLIIMAEKSDYTVLEEIIRKLDIPRSMVYIECLIMEVTVTKNFNLGTEWLAGDREHFRNNRLEGAAGGGLITSGNLATVSSGSFPPGFSLGVFSQPIKIGEVEFPTLGAIVNMYQADSDVHILSTPQLLTTDNEEASITVGQNVPYQTRTSTSDSSDTYNSYEYKDVGISLKITPQISKNRRIRLKISQETSRLIQSGEEVNLQPKTYKRSIDTTVVINDKNTVVIGGLIDDSFSETEFKIPCLGDIPLFRYLFGTFGSGGEKTNLYVFITPHVVQNPEDAEKLYKDKNGEIKELMSGSIKLYKKDAEKKETDEEQSVE